MITALITVTGIVAIVAVGIFVTLLIIVMFVNWLKEVMSS